MSWRTGLTFPRFRWGYTGSALRAVGRVVRERESTRKNQRQFLDELVKRSQMGRQGSHPRDYFSRSRSKLWFKGEESGHVQTVHEIRLDCDNDVILLKVTQLGHEPAEPSIACHTGRHSCFFHLYDNGAWKVAEPVLKDPETIYK